MRLLRLQHLHPGELGGATPDGWLEAVRAELALAAEQLPAPPVDTVFVGGGTPSLLGGDGLAAVLDAVRDAFVLAAGAEVTTEANPESTSPEFFAASAAAGYTRVSLGMQSVAPHGAARSWTACIRPAGRSTRPREALGRRVRPRQHRPHLRHAGGVRRRPACARSTPPSSAGVDHLSAYALVVEDGTALARRVRRGEITPADDDVLARRYELLDGWLPAAGFDWYEVSNWSRPGGECRHNLGYWNGGEWWGAGPGRARLRRVDAMVECQAPQRICASAGRRAAAGRRFRGARRGRPRTPRT